jgi:kynurenine 3-monooxygenase
VEVKKLKFAVIGGGMAGPLVSILLARRGYAVDLYEKRSLESLRLLASDRSFNLTLSQRGLAALRKAGLEDEIMKLVQPLHSRRTHFSDAGDLVAPYGKADHELLFSIRRSDLNRLLMQAVLHEPGVEVHDQTEFVAFDSERNELTIEDGRTQIRSQVDADFLIGADGIGSRVRDSLQRGRPATLHRTYFDWGYQEFPITAEEAIALALDSNHLHVFPRHRSLLIAIPNRDGSMTANLMLPLAGAGSFSALASFAAMEQYLDSNFSDLRQKIKNFSGKLAEKKIGYFQTLSTDVWTDGLHTLLLGDAAHAVFPFYGQGLNSALEDCVVFEQLLDQHSVEGAFVEFARERKIDTDALGELSNLHFERLKRGTKNTSGLAAYLSLSKSVYSLVAHTSLPYRKALAASKKQAGVAALFRQVALPAAALIVAALMGFVHAH